MENISGNYKKVRTVLWVILILNIGVAAAKVAVGFIINSSSVTADGFHSVADGASNVIALVGIAFAARPADNDHPYGHSKFETFTCLFIAALLFGTGFNIAKTSVLKLSAPVMPNINYESLIIMVITLLINIAVSLYEKKIGEKLGSELLISDSKHTRSDIYISIGVILSLILMKFYAPPILDPIISLIIAVFIFKEAATILRDTGGVLVDKAAIDEKLICDVVRSFGEVHDIQHIRSRGTLQATYIDMHITVDPKMDIKNSHLLVHEIEQRIREKINPNCQVIVHLEPDERE